jgi:hypothetical protein
MFTMLLRSAGTGIFSTVVAALLAGALAAPARAQAPIFNEVHTIAAPITGVPVEHTFTVTAATAGDYNIVLMDLGASPLGGAAPLASVKLAVTSGNALVGAPLIGAGTLTLKSLTAGTYVLHVVGMPGNVAGSGPIGIVVNGPGNSPVASWQDILALPSNGLPNGEAVLDPPPFAIETAGTYTVTLTDLMLPQALAAGTPTLAFLQEGAGAAIFELPDDTQQNPLQWTGPLAAGNYHVFAIGLASAPANAGLFSVVITAGSPPGGALVKGWSVPVGNTMLVGNPTLNPSAANGDTFVLTDLKYPPAPAALQEVQAVLMRKGQVIGAPLTAPGSMPFTAVADTYDVYAFGAAASAAPGAGSYAVQVTQGGTTLFGAASALTATGGALLPYSFNKTLSSGGMYTVSLTDFGFPTALTSVELAAVQGGALLGGGALTHPGNLDIKASSGPLTLLAFAQPAAGGGLFGIDVTPQAGGAPVYETAQGVGALFITRQVSVLAPGNYTVKAADLNFPAPFYNYDTIVTQGSKQLGYIFGGGSFVINAATAGNYLVNFLAEPGGTDSAGTYALTVAPAPPSPVVTFSADHTQVTSGSTVNLIWSSQNATSCNATGGWIGNKATSGTYTTPALSTNTTFTLTCTGAGGSSQPAAVTVTVTTGSGGGGGSVDPLLVLALLVLAANEVRRRRQHAGFERSRAD